MIPPANEPLSEDKEQEDIKTFMNETTEKFLEDMRVKVKREELEE